MNNTDRTGSEFSNSLGHSAYCLDPDPNPDPDPKRWVLISDKNKTRENIKILPV
jgi:hypothetical protein